VTETVPAPVTEACTMLFDPAPTAMWAQPRKTGDDQQESRAEDGQPNDPPRASALDAGLAGVAF
jgi:hypothetical protein